MPRRRYASRVTAVAPVEPSAADRELETIRELLHGMLHADRPEEAFQHALDRAGPLAGASFASVYLVDGDSELMRLAAASNWPEGMRPWLGASRVRVGFGPSGEAASERRTIEIPDVFADPELEDWHDVARELGFGAIVALPLQSAQRVLGTVAFYFRAPGELAAGTRRFLRTVAELLAAAAARAELLESLRRSTDALTDVGAELAQADVALLDARREGRALFADAAEALLRAHGSGEGLAEVVDAIADLLAAERGAMPVSAEEVDPRVPLRDAIRMARAVPSGMSVRVDEPVLALPMMRSDRRKISRTLITFLEAAFRRPESTEVRASVEVADDTVSYCVSGSDTAPSAFDLAVATATAHRLGGRIARDVEAGGWRVEVSLQCPAGARPPLPDGV